MKQVTLESLEKSSASEGAETARTRQRLLEAGAEVFAESGFRRATVREIVSRAGANVAAVNYHFGDKLGLYLAVLRHWVGVARAAYPPDWGLEKNPTPEQRLLAFVRSFLFRLLSPGPSARAGRLMGWEMVEPTQAAAEVAAELVAPMTRTLEAIVRDLLGPAAADEATVKYCACSVVGQCLFYRNAAPMLAGLFPGHEPTPAALERIAAHITRLSLAGFRDYAEHPSASPALTASP